MNERIGKLAVEAGAHWEHGDWNMPSAVYFSEKDLEKFAELIVRECISICLDKERPNLYGVREVKEAINKHFGVEE